MSRKRCRRQVFIPLPPRGLRPKLASDQVTDLALCHLQTLDDISRGRATEVTLWDLVGAAFTWSRTAELLDLGVPEMAAQLELATRVVERYGRTGRIGFSGTEYQMAKLGVDVMDQLAEIVDRPTAIAAAEWGETKVNALAASVVASKSGERQALKEAA
jgi:hypothetical protein